MTERLGRYLLIRSLAAGGMGEIFLAEHTGIAGFAKRVALKRIRPELARDKNYVSLFLNEARLGSFLNHPNIVHIFDVGHEDDNLWMVMEYVDGVDLKRLQRRAAMAGRPLPPATIATIMLDVLLALEEAHRGGPLAGAPIIHRDMSPENILIARSGAVLVLDFGLAKWVPESSAVPSLEGNMIFGKVRYMPPEQLKGHLMDLRADLFALGVVMYEALAGELPFGRGTANQVLARVMAGRPPSPTKARFGTDPAMDAIIYRALAPKADDRFQSAAEMRSALIDYLQEQRSFMVMEGLRSMLHPAAAKKGEGEVSLYDVTPTEISLSVVERCGKCGGGFTAFFIHGLILDRCSNCGGVWLDHGELDRLIGHQSEAETIAPTEFTPAPLDRLVGSCPVCRVGLSAYGVPGHPASLEICDRCLGVWFDDGELQFLGEGEVVVWLKRLLETLRVP